MKMKMKKKLIITVLIAAVIFFIAVALSSCTGKYYVSILGYVLFNEENIEETIDEMDVQYPDFQHFTTTKKIPIEELSADNGYEGAYLDVPGSRLDSAQGKMLRKSQSDKEMNGLYYTLSGDYSPYTVLDDTSLKQEAGSYICVFTENEKIENFINDVPISSVYKAENALVFKEKVDYSLLRINAYEGFYYSNTGKPLYNGKICNNFEDDGLGWVCTSGREHYFTQQITDNIFYFYEETDTSGH